MDDPGYKATSVTSSRTRVQLFTSPSPGKRTLKYPKTVPVQDTSGLLFCASAHPGNTFVSTYETFFSITQPHHCEEQFRPVAPFPNQPGQYPLVHFDGSYVVIYETLAWLFWIFGRSLSTDHRSARPGNTQTSPQVRTLHPSQSTVLLHFLRHYSQGISKVDTKTTRCWLPTDRKSGRAASSTCLLLTLFP